MASTFVDTREDHRQGRKGGNGAVAFHRRNMSPPAARTGATAGAAET